MKKQRFTEEQIIAVLKEQKQGRKPPTCAADNGFLRRLFTTGKPNTAGWKSRRRSV